MYLGIFFLKPDGSFNQTPSPLYTTQCLQKHGLKNEDTDQRLGDVMIYASDVLCPRSFGGTELHLTERTVSIHHFDATWLDDDMRKKYERTIRINKMLGDRIGYRVDKAVNDVEYLQYALKKRLRKK